VISKPLERVAEINAAFEELRALDAQPCSATHLAALRSIAFRSAIIRDVIYQGEDSGSRCNGNLGAAASDTVGTGTLRERIVPSVIELARELGVEIIVEGVENNEQVKYFRNRGVHLMQGWFYGLPLPSGELIRTLEVTQGWGPSQVPRSVDMPADDVRYELELATAAMPSAA